MLVGLTYDLKDDYLAMGYSLEEASEFDPVETIDAIDGALKELGFETDRIGGIHPLVERLARGDRWDMVFNIAEGIHGLGREAQVPAILDAYMIPYTFSDPAVMGLTLHKGFAKSILRDHGLPTPDFRLVESPDDIDGEGLKYPLFAKPVAEGTSKGITGISLIEDPLRLASVCTTLLEQFRQPVIVEEYLPGREFTVGITGTGQRSRVVAVMEVIFTGEAVDGFYSSFNKANYRGRVAYGLCDDPVATVAGRTALEAWKVLGCRDGGRVDLRCDAHGLPHFMEVNPLAGLNPEVGDLPILCRLAGVPYRQLISSIMESALLRVHCNTVPGLIHPASRIPRTVLPGRDLILTGAGG